MNGQHLTYKKSKMLIHLKTTMKQPESLEVLDKEKKGYCNKTLIKNSKTY